MRRQWNMLERWTLPRSQEPVRRPPLLHLHSRTTRTHLAGGASRMPKWHLPIFPSGREMQSHNSSASPLNKKDSPVHSDQEENPEHSLWYRLSCKTAKTERKAGQSHVQGNQRVVTLTFVNFVKRPIIMVPERKRSHWVEHGLCESQSTVKCARVPVWASQEAVRIVISIMLSTLL